MVMIQVELPDMFGLNGHYQSEIESVLTMAMP